MTKIAIKQGHKMPIIKYKDIFLVLIEEGVIPIALYRDIDGYLENNQRYIVTNPDPEIVILKDDIILVLGDTVDSKKKRLRAQTKSVNINFMKKLTQQLSFQQEPENQDKPEVEPEGSPAASPLHSDQLHPEIVTLEQIKPEEKSQETSVVDRSESLEIPQEIEQNETSKMQLSSNMPVIGLEQTNISRIEGGGEGNLLGEQFKQRSASMSRLPHVNKDVDQIHSNSDQSDYEQLDDETILLLISEQLKHSTRDRSLLKEQEQMLLKLKRARVMSRVRQFADNLKRAVQKSRQIRKIQEEQEILSQLEQVAPTDSMSQAISNVAGHKSLIKDKPRGLENFKRRQEGGNISHNADVSVPSVPPRPLSLVRRLQQEEPPKNTSFEPSPTQFSLLNISNSHQKPNARTKSTQIFSKSRV